MVAKSALVAGGRAGAARVQKVTQNYSSSLSAKLLTCLCRIPFFRSPAHIGSKLDESTVFLKCFSLAHYMYDVK